MNKVNMSDIVYKIHFIYKDECEKNVAAMVIFYNNGKYFFDEKHENEMTNDEVEALLLRGALVYKDDEYVKPSSFNNSNVSFGNKNTIALGNYIIQFNEKEDTLDFLYNGVIDEPTEEVISLVWVGGNLNSSGNEEDNSGTMRSSFVAIDTNYTYSFYLDTSMSKPGGIRVYFYDSNKTFISRTDGDALGYTTGTDISIDIPTNAAYMRFKSNIDTSTTLDNINTLFTLRKRKTAIVNNYVTEGLSMYIDANDVATYGSVRDITGKQTVTNHGVSTTLDNGCLNFVDSESDYIDGGFKPNLTRWSAEFYFYFTTPRCLLSWGARGNRTSITVWDNDFVIAINNNKTYTIMSTIPTSLTHLVVTYNNGTIIAYANGVKSQLTTSANVMSSQAGNLMVCTKYDASDEFSSTHLKSLRFYDGKVLTDEEVLQNYNYEINRG